MPKSSPKPKERLPVTSAHKRWASDVIVDLLQRYELPYAAMNPGASYRGLHDSIVNYGGNKPYMMLCQHEETAVQIAHGYAKASGKPMVAILGMIDRGEAGAVLIAHLDREPVFLYPELDDRGWAHEIMPPACGGADCEHQVVLRMVRLSA